MKKIMLYIMSTLFAAAIFVGGGFLFTFEQKEEAELPKDLPTISNLKGSGTEDDPYLILSVEDLWEMVDTGGDSAYFLQLASIDCGTEDFWSGRWTFNGYYNGNGNTLSSSVFFHIANGSVVENVVIENGPIAHYNEGTISGCIVLNCDISSLDNAVYDFYFISDEAQYIGGICGENYGEISNCVTNGELQIYSDSIVGMGGIAGWNNSGSIGSVANLMNLNEYGSSSSLCYIGGIVGHANDLSSISNVANYGEIFNGCGGGEYGEVYLGGIVGYSDSENISNCVNYNLVSSDIESSMVYLAGLNYQNEMAQSFNGYCCYGYNMDAIDPDGSEALSYYHADNQNIDLRIEFVGEQFGFGDTWYSASMYETVCVPYTAYMDAFIDNYMDSSVYLNNDLMSFEFKYSTGLGNIYTGGTYDNRIFGVSETNAIFVRVQYSGNNYFSYFPLLEIVYADTDSHGVGLGIWDNQDRTGEAIIPRTSNCLTGEWSAGNNGTWYAFGGRYWVPITLNGNGETVRASYYNNGYFVSKTQTLGSTLQLYATLMGTELSIYASSSDGWIAELSLGCYKSGYVCTGFWDKSYSSIYATKWIESGGGELLYNMTSETGITLYAQWEEATYSAVTLDENGGDLTISYNGTSTSVSSTITVYAKTGETTLYYYTNSTYYAITGITKSRTAYSALGLYTSSSGGTQVVTASGYALSSTYSGSGGETYYARWSPFSYAITYDANGGTAVSSTTYTIESTSTLPSTTKTGYTFSGWKPSSSVGSWDSSTTYASGTSLTGKYGNVTLVAQWTPRTYNQTIKIYTIDLAGTSTNSATGGEVTISYTNSSGTSTSATLSSASRADTARYATTVSLTATAKSGYAFVGFGTRVPSPTSEPSVTTSWTVSGSKSMFAYFKAVSDNQLKYDSTGKYYYFEDGYFPQSYVGDTANTWLSNNVNLGGETWEINGYELAIANDITYSGTTDVLTSGTAYDFARLTMDGEQYWFKFEPIRWRVSDYGVENTPSNWATYGISKSDFTVVSDNVLWLSEFSSSFPSGVGYSVADASINDIFDQMASLNTSDFGTFSYLSTDDVTIDVDTYNSESSSTKVTNTTTTLSGGSLRVASLAEIDENLSNFKAKASDLVATILGQSGYVNYWTRNLGQYYGNGNYVLKNGDKRNNGSYTNVMGVRFAMTMTEGSRY